MKYEGYENGFSIHVNRPRAHLKTSCKRKKPTLATESWENKKKSKNRPMVHKSEVANTKKAENPLSQANYWDPIFSSTGTSAQSSH